MIRLFPLRSTSGSPWRLGTAVPLCDVANEPAAMRRLADAGIVER
ncbi:hypothetical protein [Benzoatithermus flavus]|uniref:Uncharacterized protein n=1 Tax=Benzoatithermus flavus TaxID=3108223 RepID=A0ABU8XLR4_9PROT